MKYDDATWHIADAKDDAYAAAHIALIYVWLIEHGYIQQSVLNGLELHTPLDRSKTPTQYLYEYSDGKLVNDDFTDEGKKLLSESAYNKYMNDFAMGIKGVKYSFIRRNSPYRGKDTWKSLKALDTYFLKV